MFEDLFHFLISILVGGGIGVGIVAVLSKKIVEHLLNKNIENFKSKILIYQKLSVEQKLYAFKEEVDHLKKLWPLMMHICKVCGSYQTEDVKILHNAVSKAEDFIDKNEPYINEGIFNLAKEIMQIADPEQYTADSYKELSKIKDEFISEYRNRTFLT